MQRWDKRRLPGNAAMSGSVALRAARGLGHGLARQAPEFGWHPHGVQGSSELVKLGYILYTIEIYIYIEIYVYVDSLGQLRFISLLEVGEEAKFQTFIFITIHCGLNSLISWVISPTVCFWYLLSAVLSTWTQLRLGFWLPCSLPAWG